MNTYKTEIDVNKIFWLAKFLEQLLTEIYWELRKKQQIRRDALKMNAETLINNYKFTPFFKDEK